MDYSSNLKTDLLSVVWLLNWSCCGTALHTEKMFEVLYFLPVLCIFDYHNTGQIVKAVDEHSPDHGHTAMTNWKLLFPKGRHLGAVAHSIRACPVTEGKQCSGNTLTAQLGYPILFISYSLSTSG